MKINEKKSHYMVITRSKINFGTRIQMNNTLLENVNESKIVGVWITSNMKWDKNTRELAKKAYMRMSMLTKLKYVGTCTEDLIDTYVRFIRSKLEYCAVVWHSSLTIDQRTTLERVQKTCLRVILGECYVSYEAALEMCNLTTLFQRREDRCLSFVKKCLTHPVHRKLFPPNNNKFTPNKKNKHSSREQFHVNYARTEAYRHSTVPYLQRMLNNLN